MSKCPSTPMRVTTITFDGINLTPLSKTAMIKLGGVIADGGETDNAGRYFGGQKQEPSEVEFEIPNTADFNPELFRGQCGELMFLTDGGTSYLVTNAQCSSNIELKDGENKIKLQFKGDAAVIY